MRIAIDGSAIPKQMAGAGVYTFQLVRALAQIATEHEFVVFTRDRLFDDLDSRLELVPTGGKHPALRLAWEQAALPFLLRRHQIDLLHSPHHHAPVVVSPSIRRVVTFNDVTFLLLPERYPRIRRYYMAAVTRAAARVVDAVITPSEAVTNDVLKELSLGPEIVTTIPDAAGPQYAPSAGSDVARVRSDHDLSGPYILSVGSQEPGKNRARLIQAFERIQERHGGVQLVVVGQPAWNYESDVNLVRKLGLQQHVRFLGYVPDGDLPALYAGATFSVFPSLYEGFGLPVLESMASGTPVLTSNVGATAEVAGDAAVLVDPYDVDAIADAIARLLDEEELRVRLRTLGLERASQFSWDRTARETLAVYERLLAS
ncbi:MAG: glycosyltransferase family 4 protein [Chloroflexi bacterium]|nr:glycosyltransferase family 4 protein [Chloroflexota bacterium]MCH8007819.1 glycosyltransferase family 4 protein [Chloroflexota bacterium]